MKILKLFIFLIIIFLSCEKEEEILYSVPVEFENYNFIIDCPSDWNKTELTHEDQSYQIIFEKQIPGSNMLIKFSIFMNYEAESALIGDPCNITINNQTIPGAHTTSYLIDNQGKSFVEDTYTFWFQGIKTIIYFKNIGGEDQNKYAYILHCINNIKTIN